MARINLTLRPAFLFGLELLARDRRTSLSQAAEYALGIALREHLVDGVPAIDIATKGTLSDSTGTPQKLAAYDLHKSTELDATESEKVLRGTTFIEKMLVMPDRLKTAEEKFVLAVLEGSNSWPPQGRYDTALEGFRAGLSVRETIERMEALADTNNR